MISLSANIRKKIWYVFFALLGVWWILTIYLWYDYIITSSDKKVTKWGTFVQAIFDKISYLPYVSNKTEHRFYQWLLFNWCLSYQASWYKVMFQEDLCKISTNDYKTYFVSLTKDIKRSDGKKISIDDIFFTYNTIIRNNLWNISEFSTFKKLTVDKLPDWRIKVSFPNESIDNTNFFTNFILPSHILQNKSLDQYIQIYRKNPITSNCATVLPQRSDDSSLVFGLANCLWTNLSFFQIKNFPSWENFKQYHKDAKQNIVDMYVYQEPLSWYENKKIISNKYMALFFNTESRKIGNRLRGSLSYFIHTKFSDSDSDQYLAKDLILFNDIESKWDIKSLLEKIQKPSSENLLKDDFDNVNIPSLPGQIDIKWRNKKAVYYLNKLSTNLNLKIMMDNDFDKITIVHDSSPEYTPSVYDKKNRVTFYNLSEDSNTIHKGLNKYVISWYRGKRRYILKTLDVYYIDEPTTPQQNSLNTQVDTWNKIRIIYLDTDPVTLFIVDKLKVIFEKYRIWGYFDFVWYDYVDEFDGKVSSKDYDIVIRWIDLWFKKDISNIFLTDQSLINPSLYKNPNFASLISQFFIAPDKTKWVLKKEIDDIYSNDMPFLFFGKVVGDLYIKKNFSQVVGSKLYEYNYRTELLKNIQLVKSIDVDKNVLFNRDTLISYFKKHLNY